MIVLLVLVWQLSLRLTVDGVNGDLVAKFLYNLDNINDDFVAKFLFDFVHILFCCSILESAINFPH